MYELLLIINFYRLHCLTDNNKVRSFRRIIKIQITIANSIWFNIVFDNVFAVS